MALNKRGFTLIELMVVAIVVAVLAAVAIPLMSGNRGRAVATEGQTGCSIIATAARLYFTEHNVLPDEASGAALRALPGIATMDLSGSYFNESGYSYRPTGTRAFMVTATARATAPAQGDVVLTVDEDQTSVWSGTLLD